MEPEMTPPKPVCYWLEDGTKVLFPIGPIDGTGITKTSRKVVLMKVTDEMVEAAIVAAYNWRRLQWPETARWPDDLEPVEADMERVEMRRAIEAALNATSNFEWQPIETAPMDGTEVLLCDANCKYQFIRVAKWDDNPTFDTHHWEDLNDALFHYSDKDFTHWRPLPTSPKETVLGTESQPRWKCPINHPGCTRNCGNYGCGN